MPQLTPTMLVTLLILNLKFVEDTPLRFTRAKAHIAFGKLLSDHPELIKSTVGMVTPYHILGTTYEAVDLAMYDLVAGAALSPLGDTLQFEFSEESTRRFHSSNWAGDLTSWSKLSARFTEICLEMSRS